MHHRTPRIGTALGIALTGCTLSLAAHADSAGRGAAPPPAAGFRMEGDPELEAVFGDTRAYQRHVDRFYDLAAAMDATRGAFTRHVRDTLSTLAPHPRACPLDAVAPMYAAAHRSGRAFRELGAELEAQRGAIAMLDGLGETAGLTPDYRWRVSRTERLYQASLRDYREMRSIFDRQLGPELTSRRCNLDRLLTVGELALEERARAAAAEASAGAASPTPGASAKTAAPPASRARLRLPDAAAAATFFIDNTKCSEGLRVYVDGVQIGEAAPAVKAAFQAPPGRHQLCLIPRTSGADCGDPGTVRSVYVHDGWSMSLRCARDGS